MKKTGVQLIAIERKEHKDKHGFDETDDDTHNHEEMMWFAVYCLTGDSDFYPTAWANQWQEKLFKKNRIEQLTIAGSMIAAQIDLLLREAEISDDDSEKK